MPVHRAGDIILRDYQIEAFIGEGGFGEVYRALQVDLNQRFALKILQRARLSAAGYAAAEIRFHKEAQLGVRINHPAIVRVFSFSRDKESDQLVLVMTYAAGGSLRQALDDRRERRQPYSVPDALRIARGIAAGLAALHAQKVIHRDLSPNNILFDGAGTPLIADLGLAQTAADPSLGRGDSDQPPPHPGTPGYRSPEHADGYNLLKPPADIYALGLLLFEMLTLEPYASCRPGTRLGTLRPDVPAALDELVAGMLSEEPRRRPWDGAAAEKALQELSAAEPAAPAVSPIRSRTPATWSLEDGLSALKDMEEAQDWQLAAEQLAELEAAYPNHPKLKLPHKRITQALEDQAQAQREAEEKSKREAEAQARHEAEEKSKREAELRPGYLRRAGDHIFIRLDSAQEMAFVRIPAGEFLMGSDPEKDKQASANEQPQHLVSLPEYWMGQTPVTNAQYAAYIMAMKGKALSPWKNNQPPQDKLDHPVVHVSWKDAVAYCAWLSELTGRRVGLPTEAEWEKAARGTDGRIYPWGDQDPDEKRCNFDGQAGGTTPVGRYSPTGDSPYGCVDMAGNVWELCADWSDEFGALSLSFLLSNASKLGADRCDSNNDPKSTTTCPTCPIGPPIGDPRFMRGGAWFYDTDDVRAALRDWCPSDSCYSDVGFRCCLSAAP